MKPVVKLLRAAKRKISDPEAWCQGYYAQDVLGEITSSGSYEAVKWCSIGAISYCSGGTGSCRQAIEYLRAVVGRHVPHFNDDETTTHKDVMRAFNQAIKLAQKKEKNNNG